MTPPFARHSLASMTLAACLLGGLMPVFGQGPAPTPAPAPVVPVASIVAPASVPPGAPLVLFGDDAVSKSPLNWVLIAPKGTPFRVYGTVLIVREPVAGVTYKFAQVAFGDAPPFAFDFADVTVGALPPPPPVPPIIPPTPAPDPQPPVPPAPTVLPLVGKGWIATLIIPADATPAQLLAIAPLADSITLHAAVEALGGRLYKVSAPSKEYDRRNLAPFLAANDTSGAPVTVPALVVQDARGTVLRKIPAPVDEPAMLAYLRSLTGGK